METRETMTRRKFIVGSICAGSAALGMSAGGMIFPKRARAADPVILPLPVTAIDPESVRYYAFSHYFNGGCMHGASSGLMQAFKEAFSGQETAWDLLPYGMYAYGAGGVAGWGTLCGILNGTLAVLNLAGLHGVLGNEIMGWYATTRFPLANCEGFVVETAKGQVAAIPDSEVLAHTVSDSPLCHISIGKWCKAAGVGIKDTNPENLKYKDDRCSKICADTAAKAADLVNEYLLYSKIQPTYISPADVEDCLVCHGTSDRADQVGKMDCMGCHSPDEIVRIGSGHPVKQGKRNKT